MPLPSRALGHARGHLRVSGVLLDGPRKKRDCSESKVMHNFNFYLAKKKKKNPQDSRTKEPI